MTPETQQTQPATYHPPGAYRINLDVTAPERLLAALARRDFEVVEGCLDPAVRFRALTPKRVIEAVGAADVVGYARRWFGDADAFEVQAAEVSEVGGRQHLRYRFRLHDEDGWQVIEQQAYLDVRAGLVTALDLLCSGFRPEEAPTGAEPAEATASGATGPMPGMAQATLDARGEGCATLTPLIRNRLRELQSGEMLEVRSDDPAAREGVPAWSRMTGNELVASDSDGDVLRFYLRKK